MIRRDISVLKGKLPNKRRERLFIPIGPKDEAKIQEMEREMRALEGRPELRKKLYMDQYRDLKRIKLPFVYVFYANILCNMHC
jgi:hypothetical protein